MVLADRAQRWSQIGIGADDQRTVELIRKCVGHELDRNSDVSFLFLVPHPLRTALETLTVLLFEMANDASDANVLKCFNVLFMP